MDNFLNSPELKKLSGQVSSGKCVAFVGSGLSYGEYVSWSGLVKQLCAACGVVYDAGDAKLDLLELAQNAKDASAERYHEVLSREFGKPGVHLPPGYRYLIESPFTAYITINYDHLLAEAGLFEGLDVFEFKRGLDAASVKDKAMFYIHGFVNEGDEVVDGDLILTAKDFEDNYEAIGSIIPSFLTQVFLYKPVVFIGCGLQEDALRKLLVICQQIKRRIEAGSNQEGPTHYILLPTVYTEVAGGTKSERDLGKEAEEDEFYRDIGVQVVRFVRESPEDYGPVEKILRKWSNAPVIRPISAYAERPTL